MNLQSIEKCETDNIGLLSVHSIFYTIQGEGPFCGTPAVFIRLAGCNLQCPACDTDYTTDRHLMNYISILEEVLEHTDKGLVVITGGEPFRQEIRPLIAVLLKAGFYIQIETNGTLAPPLIGYSLIPDKRKGVYIVCSPKTGKIHPQIYEDACALKYVVEADHILLKDGLPLRALGHPSNPYPARPPQDWNRPVYVQPMDAHDEVLNKTNMDIAVSSCLDFGYILQLQIHKIIGVE